MEHVNFQPKGMTVEQLSKGYEWLNSSFYSFSSMYRRIFKLHRSRAGLRSDEHRFSCRHPAQEERGMICFMFSGSAAGL